MSAILNSACRIIHASSNGLPWGNHGVGVAVEECCRGDVGGQAPSRLTLTLGWGRVDPLRWGWVAREPWVGLRAIGWVSFV